MDLSTYLQAKADRCRKLAAGERGDTARDLLRLAEQFEADQKALQARFLSVLQQTRYRLAHSGHD